MVDKNPQANTIVEWAHQVINNMIVTKYFSNIVFEYIYPWDR